MLIQECRNLKLIGDKIWIWDRRFFKCNCNGLKKKETGTLSDPDAGHYVKKAVNTVYYRELNTLIHVLLIAGMVYLFIGMQSTLAKMTTLFFRKR
jgi:hypothetical protein